MAKDPAFLFYSADFYMGTVGMSHAQIGQYITLLCLQHQQGRLREGVFKSVAGAKPDEVLLSKFAVDENGLYFNARLEREAEKRTAYVASRRSNARAKTPLSNEETTQHMDMHMREHMPNHMPEHSEAQVDTTMHEHMENENVNVNIDTNTKGRGSRGRVKPERHKYGEYDNVLLSDEEYGKLTTEYPRTCEALIERLSGYMKSTGKVYKDHLATMRNWARRDGQDDRPTGAYGSGAGRENGRAAEISSADSEF